MNKLFQKIRKINLNISFFIILFIFGNFFYSCNYIGFYKINNESFIKFSYRIFTNKDLNILFGLNDNVVLPLYDDNYSFPKPGFFDILTPYDSNPFIEKKGQQKLYPLYISINVKKISEPLDIIDLYNILKNSYLYCLEEKTIYKSLSNLSILTLQTYNFNLTNFFKEEIFKNLNYNEKLLYSFIEKYKNKKLSGFENINLNFGYFFLLKNTNTYEKNNFLIFFNNNIIKLKVSY